MTSPSQNDLQDEDNRPTRRFPSSQDVANINDFIETKRANRPEAPSDSVDAPLGLHASNDGAEASTLHAETRDNQESSSGTFNPFLSGDTIERVPRAPARKSNTAFLEKAYEIIEEIDRGGMGLVYSARCRESGADVVIKVLPFMTKDDRRLVRFQREAAALSLFEHPNILRLRKFGVHWEDAMHGVPYLVTDRVGGPNLRKIVSDHLQDHKKAPDPQWLIQVFTELGRALSECHAKGIIHRDIKPANVVIDRPGDQAILIDFGLSKADPEVFQESISAFKETLTATGQVLGTPMYMAPEQLFGQRDQVGAPADVWSFAASFYYSLCGRLPFDVATPLKLVEAMESSDPPPIRQHVPDLPAWLEGLLADCFQKEIALRPSIDDVVRRLEQRESASEVRGAKRFWPILIFALLVLALGAYGLTFWRSESVKTARVGLTLDRGFSQKRAKSVVEIQGTLSGEGPFQVHFERVKGQGPDKTLRVENAPYRLQAVLELQPGVNQWKLTIVGAKDRREEILTIRKE